MRFETWTKGRGEVLQLLQVCRRNGLLSEHLSHMLEAYQVVEGERLRYSRPQSKHPMGAGSGSRRLPCWLGVRVSAPILLHVLSMSRPASPTGMSCRTCGDVPALLSPMVRGLCPMHGCVHVQMHVYKHVRTLVCTQGDETMLEDSWMWVRLGQGMPQTGHLLSSQVRRRRQLLGEHARLGCVGGVCEVEEVLPGGKVGGGHSSVLPPHLL